MGEAIERARDYTEKKLRELQAALSELGGDNWSVVANGSYARYEASPQSDFDYFILHDDTVVSDQLDELSEKVRRLVGSTIGRLPSSDGAFGATLPLGSLSRSIGGSSDGNDNITRRMLFITEGKPINNSHIYDRQRDELIGRYINGDISDHQLGLFLLNDMIRYYRTICVDFEFKTFEASKAWGIRNIKLVFSRKILYFSGALIVAETAQRHAEEKREIVRELVALPPIQRIKRICRSAADRALESYEIFLQAMECAQVRRMLEDVTSDRKTHVDQFKRLKNEGQHFSFHLMSALRSTYSEAHPIHRALIM